MAYLLDQRTATNEPAGAFRVDIFAAQDYLVANTIAPPERKYYSRSSFHLQGQILDSFALHFIKTFLFRLKS